MDTLSGQIRLDFRSDTPLYQQIVEQVAGLVREGVLQPGDQLPTVRQMAIDLRINFSTVARAYHLLDEQRIISTQRGRGTYIWDEGHPGAEAIEGGMPAAEAPGDEALAARLAREFIESAARQGLSLPAIRQAFEQEVEAIDANHGRSK